MRIKLRGWYHLTMVLGACCAVSAVFSPCTAHTRYVIPDSTGLATPIAAALDSASSGDTVLVAAGTYLETDDPATWIAPGPGVALVSEDGPDLTVIEFCNATTGIKLSSCEGVVVSGFTVRFAEHPGCGYPGGWISGIRCYQCTDVLVENCVIEEVGIGIWVSDRSQEWWKPEFHDNVIRNCGTGIWCMNNRDPGRPHLLGNSITYCEIGVDVANSSPNIEACEIAYCSEYGLLYVGHCGGGVWSSVIAHNADGAIIYSDPPLAVPSFNGSWLPEEANDIYDNSGWDIWYEHSTPDALVMAIYNYWGTECPDFTSRLHGRVLHSPWMDSTHTVVLNEDHCPQAVEPSTWGCIKAMFE
jgi:hypothetical protein